MLDTEEKVVLGLAPVADAFSGTVYSTAVDAKNFENVEFHVIKGVGLLGTSTITVEKCTKSDGTGATAIGFYYRRITAAGVAGAWTLATSAGFTTTAGSNETYEVQVNTKQEGLGSANTSHFLRLKAVEVVNDPVLGGVLIELSGGRYGKDG